VVDVDLSPVLFAPPQAASTNPAVMMTSTTVPDRRERRV